eukprot:2729010-Rhodomonas_salina.1
MGARQDRMIMQGSGSCWNLILAPLCAWQYPMRLRQYRTSRGTRVVAYGYFSTGHRVLRA